jgi:hypothetical protein
MVYAVNPLASVLAFITYGTLHLKDAKSSSHVDGFMTALAPIICLEGPSAVGKSTVARRLADGHGYLVIPEVNELFQNEKRSGDDWYLRRQIDRYAQATSAAASGQPVVLDGDPFQPLWYNWIYPEYGPLPHVIAFYRDAIDAGTIAFPGMYAVLQASNECLTIRRAGDAARRRRNFDRHLQMIAPQRRYFEQLGASGFTKVEVIENVDAEDVALKIVEAARSATAVSESAQLLTIASNWLSKNHPHQG